MNLVFDIGNTAVKWAAFEGHSLVDSGRWNAPPEDNGQAESLRRRFPDATRLLACASGDATPLLHLFPNLPLLSASTPLPVKIGYKSPQSLGTDRIAAACGAHALHPGKPCLVIDAGTCITVDFLDAEGSFLGGAIMPGVAMNLQALHTFTAKLPLLDIACVSHAPVLGRTTEESILAGTLGATLLALAGFVALYKEKCPDLQVLLTGGDAPRLAASGNDGWQLCPQLSLTGLNEVIMMNDQQ